MVKLVPLSNPSGYICPDEIPILPFTTVFCPPPIYGINNINRVLPPLDAAQFGAWTFGPPHGFARIVRWNVEKPPERLPSGDVEAIFSIMDSEFTRSMWNYPFKLTYRLILREKELHFNIGVYNPSKDHTFSFNLLLHTYFKVPDVRRCQITGLHGCTFIDKV